MKIKYLYESDDEESDFESDDEKREKSRELFRKRKEEQKKVKNNCEICDFTGKTPGGLKTRVMPIRPTCTCLMQGAAYSCNLSNFCANLCM